MTITAPLPRDMSLAHVVSGLEWAKLVECRDLALALGHHALRTNDKATHATAATMYHELATIVGYPDDSIAGG